MKDQPDQYLGEGCVDQEGTPIREGDEVYFLSSVYPIRRKNFVNSDGKTLSRLEISGANYWLTSYSASMCRVRARNMSQRLQRQGRIFNHSGTTKQTTEPK